MHIIFMFANSILILLMTIFLAREIRHRRALEQVLNQSIEIWRKVSETNLEGPTAGPGQPYPNRVPD